MINQRLASAQQDAGITRGATITDAKWCERAFRRLIGRAPHADELAEFVNDTSSDKRAGLLDRLLGDQSKYASSFSEHWATRWSGWLLDRSSVRPNERKAYRAGLESFLAKSLLDGRSYASVTRQMLTAAGSNESTRDDYEPATNFLLATLDADASDVTAHVCRTVLGRRARCAQCHDDANTRLTQARFWTIASAFKSLEWKRLRVGRGRILERKETTETRYQTPSGTWHTVDAVAGTNGESPRASLADKMLASDRFREAAVNRFWSQLLQYGFSFPVDDLGTHNPVSHPQLVDYLGEQFAASDYDVRRLLRWIVLSDAFDRSESIDSGNLKDFPDGGLMALFSRDYHRPTVFQKSTDGLSALAAGRRPQVVYAADEPNQSVTQARRMRDLDAKKRKRRRDIATGQLMPLSYLRTVRAVAEGKLTPAQKIEHAFLMTLSRTPTEAERKQAAKIFAKNKKDDVAALEQIFWALLNTETQ